MFTKKNNNKKKSIKLSLCILQKKSRVLTTVERETWKSRSVFVCGYGRAPPAFMNNTIKQSNGFSEILQLSERLKNGTFSLVVRGIPRNVIPGYQSLSA